MHRDGDRVDVESQGAGAKHSHNPTTLVSRRTTGSVVEDAAVRRLKVGMRAHTAP